MLAVPPTRIRHGLSASPEGAQVHVHPFESFGKQRNWAIDNIPSKHDWVFHLDADERFTPAVQEMHDRLSRNPAEAGFHNPHKLMFMDSGSSDPADPTYQMRLFHKAGCGSKDYGHGQREDTEQTVGVFERPYLHYGILQGPLRLDRQAQPVQLARGAGGHRVAARAVAAAETSSAETGEAPPDVEGAGLITAVPPDGPLVRDHVHPGRGLRGAGGVHLREAGRDVRADDDPQAPPAQEALGRRMVREGNAPKARTNLFRTEDRFPEPAGGAPSSRSRSSRASRAGPDDPRASPWSFREKLIRRSGCCLGPVFGSRSTMYGFRAERTPFRPERDEGRAAAGSGNRSSVRKRLVRALGAVSFSNHAPAECFLSRRSFEGRHLLVHRDQLRVGVPRPPLEDPARMNMITNQRTIGRNGR